MRYRRWLIVRMCVKNCTGNTFIKKCRWGLLHRQISVFYVGGEYDLCFGTAELLEFVDEVVQFHGGAEGYFDEHGVIAGDAVAFDDVWDGLDEGAEVFFLVGFYFQVDECFYMITEKYRVDLGVVACDQPFFSRCSTWRRQRGRRGRLPLRFPLPGCGRFSEAFR